MSACLLLTIGIQQLLVKADIAVETKYIPKAVVVMHRLSNEIVYAHQQHDPNELASVTKLMTVYTALNTLKKANRDLEEKIKIDEDTYQISKIKDLSNNQMIRNGIYSIKELLYLNLLSSSNAASNALAKAVSGSEAKFVDKMNQTAHELGLQNSKFYNSHGVGDYVLPLENHFGVEWKESLSSAKDIALLTDRLIEMFPFVLEISNHRTYEIGKYNGFQEVIESTLKDTLNQEINGLKTGTGNVNNVVLTTNDYIIVLLGVGSDKDDKNVRFKMGEKLLKYLAPAVEKTTILKKGIHFIDQTKLVLENDFEVWNNHKNYTLALKGDMLHFQQAFQNPMQQAVKVKILSKKGIDIDKMIIIAGLSVVLLMIIKLSWRKKTRNTK